MNAICIILASQVFKPVASPLSPLNSKEIALISAVLDRNLVPCHPLTINRLENGIEVMVEGKTRELDFKFTLVESKQDRFILSGLVVEPKKILANEQLIESRFLKESFASIMERGYRSSGYHVWSRRLQGETLVMWAKLPLRYHDVVTVTLNSIGKVTHIDLPGRR